MNASEQPTDVPIACNPQVFSQGELDEHILLAMDVIYRLPKCRRDLPDGFLFEYEGTEELFLKVARFVANEHRCCPWESFVIEMDPFAPGTNGAIRLRYLGGARGKETLIEGVRTLEAAASDPQALERLRAALGAFTTITAANKDRFYEQATGHASTKASTFLEKLKSTCRC